jgi:hypothetical protein
MTRRQWALGLGGSVALGLLVGCTTENLAIGESAAGAGGRGTADETDTTGSAGQKAGLGPSQITGGHAATTPAEAAGTTGSNSTTDITDDPGAPKNLELGPWGFCGGRTYAMACPSGSASGSGVRDGGECAEVCWCTPDCTAAEDCPLPESGTAVPVCSEFGECELPCADGENCPDGMECTETNNGLTMCGWVTTPEENLHCSMDPCSQYATQEACERQLRTDPHQMELACVWANETLYSTTNSSCEPLKTVESCVLAQRSDNQCERGAQCGSTGLPIYFGDVGGGTVAIVEVETTCYFVPMQSASVRGGLSACAFGDPTLPVLCDCSCPSAGASLVR